MTTADSLDPPVHAPSISECMDISELIGKLSNRAVATIATLMLVKTTNNGSTLQLESPKSLEDRDLLGLYIGELLTMCLYEKMGLLRKKFRDFKKTLNPDTPGHEWLLYHHRRYRKAIDWHAATYSLFCICIGIHCRSLGTNESLANLIDCGFGKSYLLEYLPNLVHYIERTTDTMIQKNNIERGKNYRQKSLALYGKSDIIIDRTLGYIRSYTDSNKVNIEMMLANFCHNGSALSKSTIIDPLRGEFQVEIKVNHNDVLKIINIICDDQKHSLGNLHVIYDLETSGFPWRDKQTGAMIQPEIVQITLRDYHSGMIICNNYIRPQRYLRDVICKLIGVTNDGLRDKPDIHRTKTWLADRLRHISKMHLYAHNGIKFDAPIMVAHGMIPNRIQVEWKCTIPLIQGHHSAKNDKLGSIYESVFHEPIKNQHTALADVDALCRIFRHFKVDLS